MNATLLLIRHAETVWNRDGRLQGFGDSPLSETGHGQAEQLRSALLAWKIGHVVSSDAPRCLETARIALAGRDLTVVPDAGLRERNLGDWEGRHWSAVEAVNADAVRRYHADPSYRPDGGETWLELQSRVVRSVDTAFQHAARGAVAVFGSGGTVRAFLMHAGSIPPEKWTSWAVFNTSITELTYADGRWKVVRFNDTHHLTALTVESGI